MSGTSRPVPRLLLVHGWGGSGAQWAPVIAAWSGNVRLDVVDLPGHGGPREYRDNSPWTIAAAVQTVVDDLESRGPAVLVGHSMGGQVTTLVHAARPELVDAEVVVDPAYGHPADDLPRLRAWWRRVEADGGDAVLPFVRGAFGAATDEDTRALIERDLKNTPGPVLASYLFSEYLADGAIGVDTASRALLTRRTRPALGIYSTSSAAAFERSAGVATVDVWRGHGHYLAHEDPARFAMTVSTWLDERP